MKSQFRGIGNHVSGTGNHQVLNASLLANALVANAYPDISLVDLISITDALASLDEYVKIW
ncbi:MAG: hypothetical protein F8N38_04850 [Hungatella sp.]|nr:hypothetical protein [Hungatella sp.]